MKNIWKEYNVWEFEYNSVRKKLENIDINFKDKLYERLEHLYILKELNEYYVYKENWIQYNSYLKLLEIFNKIPDEYKNKHINDVINEIKWYDDKILLENETKSKNNDLNILKSKKYKWLYNEIIENIEAYNIKEKISYWNNIIKIKPYYDDKKIIEAKIEAITVDIYSVSNEFYKYKGIYDDHMIKKRDLEIYKSFTCNLNLKLEILENIITKLSNYRSWLYKEKIIHKIIDRTNTIIENFTDKHLRLDANFNDDCTIQWCFQDGTNKPIIEKASGFQKFIFGISGIPKFKFLSLYLKSYHSAFQLLYMKNRNKHTNKIRDINNTVNDDSVFTKFVIVTYNITTIIINQITYI
jgi:hypothetical protein